MNATTEKAESVNVDALIASGDKLLDKSAANAVDEAIWRMEYGKFKSVFRLMMGLGQIRPSEDEAALILDNAVVNDAKDKLIRLFDRCVELQHTCIENQGQRLPKGCYKPAYEHTCTVATFLIEHSGSKDSAAKARKRWATHRGIDGKWTPND